MKLEIASHKAVVYACKNYHYSKSVPAAVLSFSVFNNINEWCGVIIYSGGANKYIGSPFGLPQGAAIELVRVALNGKQESTSKAIAISLKLIKKYAPLVKLIISYADKDQNHIGTIYQATNWIYIGKYGDNAVCNKIVNGRKLHNRSIGSLYGTHSIEKLQSVGLNVIPVRSKGKYKYIYPIDI